MTLCWCYVWDSNVFQSPRFSGEPRDLGYFDLETRVLEPLENLLGPKVLPMLVSAMSAGQTAGWSAHDAGDVIVIPGGVKHALRNSPPTPPVSTSVKKRYTAYPAPPISRWDEDGFSSCSTCPCHRATPTTPPECHDVSVSPRHAMLPSPVGRGLGLRSSFSVEATCGFTFVAAR